ncbi:MAG: sigma-54-dependent Fis family transcriptional regulator [Desulfovibrio sp.]|jgi:transcriptional regulator of acetoin/glycerol metabolism|nr:sigma-54-dependent Fis family transcriptional regulator [Desulfovibrio sp.]
MHILHRNGDIYELCENVDFIPQREAQRPALREMFHHSPEDRPRYEQWKYFVEHGLPSGLKLHRTLLASWERCRSLEVNPTALQCSEFTPMQQLETAVSLYHELAQDIEKSIYFRIKDSGLLITVTDSNARVLRTCGPRHILKLADLLNFGPGASWTESSVGTNAIGTSLVEGVPLQVLGEEHYCRSHHAWSCTAAPIFDPHGNMWGCFDISGPVASDHRHALQLVIEAAREIERRMFTAYLADIEVKSRSLLGTVLNAAQTGILAVGGNGNITYSNRTAEALLGQRGNLCGQRADAYVDYGLFLRKKQRGTEDEAPVTLVCRANPALRVLATPLPNSGCGHEAIITLNLPGHTPPSPRILHSLQPAQSFGEQRFGDVLYTSAAMSQVVHRARQVAQTPSTLLIFGETGTGKELFARAIHNASPRAAGPFVALDCGSLPRELIQSEFFGYKRGAFTGALHQGRMGKFQQADKGTLFLDEISEMPLDMQVNLLRPLEERRITLLGDNREHSVDLKIIVATNRNLEDMVAKGLFRQDLFYRINVIQLNIPPLRQRKEDIRLLAEYYARKLSGEFSLPFVSIDPDVTDILLKYSWPGNVRELLHCIEYAVNVMRDGVIRVDDLPPNLAQNPLPPAPERGGRFKLHDATAETIRKALAFHGDNISHTASALGIGRNTLYAKLKKFGLR